METQLTLAELSKNISDKILDSINLLSIMQDISDGDCKTDTIIRMITDNLKGAFNEIEECRQKIYIID